MKYGDIEFERRVFPRFTLHLPFTYSVEDQPSRQGETVNASKGGLLAYLPERPETGAAIRLKMALTEANKVRQIEVVARVVWVKENPEGGAKVCKVGLEFVEIAPDDEKFLKEFEQIWLEQAG